MTMYLAACEGNNCPRKNNCKRFQIQQQYLEEGKYYPYYVGSSYKDGSCALFLDKNEDATSMLSTVSAEYQYYY